MEGGGVEGASTRSFCCCCCCCLAGNMPSCKLELLTVSCCPAHLLAASGCHAGLPARTRTSASWSRLQTGGSRVFVGRDLRRQHHNSQSGCKHTSSTAPAHRDTPLSNVQPPACNSTSMHCRPLPMCSCPCVHANWYSNKRWCCGDMLHLDLGREVFKEVGDAAVCAVDVCGGALLLPGFSAATTPQPANMPHTMCDHHCGSSQSCCCTCPAADVRSSLMSSGVSLPSSGKRLAATSECGTWCQRCSLARWGPTVVMSREHVADTHSNESSYMQSMFCL
jgi:hypothetical protein